MIKIMDDWQTHLTLTTNLSVIVTDCSKGCVPHNPDVGRAAVSSMSSWSLTLTHTHPDPVALSGSADLLGYI